MNVIKLFSSLSGLASCHRYSMMAKGRPESVLEHTGMVLFFSILMAHEINFMRPETINISSMASKAIIHDVDELIVGDIPRPTKWHNQETRSMFRTIEERGVKRVLGELELSGQLQTELFAQHKSSKDGRDGLIVAIADAMCVAHCVWEEVLVRNNRSMVRQARTVKLQFKRLYQRVTDEFEDDPSIRYFLTHLLIDSEKLMNEASLRDDPMIGSIQEEVME